MMPRCSVRKLVDRHFETRIAPGAERRLREHLPGCRACRDHYERHLLLSKLDPAAPSAADRMASALALGPASRVALARWTYAAVAAAAAAALVMVLVRPDGSDQFQSRGNDVIPLAVDAYRVGRGHEPTPLGDVLLRDEELAFAYHSGVGDRFLMIVGLDEHGHVYWYHPAWTDPSASPTSIPLAEGRHELPEAISHDLDGRELTLFAVTTREPLNVQHVERKIADNPDWLAKAASWSRRLRVVD